MDETRESLEARKRDLFAAIRTLDSDLESGAIDEESYRSARERYELEAAQVLEQLDKLPAERAAPSPAGPSTDRPVRRKPRWMNYLTIAVVAGAIIVVLLGALQRRDENQALSDGNRTTSDALVQAQKAVRRNPQSVSAQIALGNAFLDLQRAHDAHVAYQRAMKLAPNNPRPKTLDAMALSAQHQRVAALALLARVEKAYPAYARAWLLDGIVASQQKSRYPRAVRSWERFVALQPKNQLTPLVKGWIEAAKRGKSPGAAGK